MMNREKPKALGTREIPEGQPNCFEGYKFVLTGELETLTRDNVADIIKRHGGRVIGSVSRNTTFLIKGRDCGQSKIQKATQIGTRIIDEDAFYNLLATEGSKGTPSSAPAPEPKQKEKAKPTSSASKKEPTKVETNDLWTVKYRPRSTKEILGNKTSIVGITEWLKEWQENKSKGFPANGSIWSNYRAILISGPPGIGKTTAAHVIAEECGYHPLEFNASDSRNKKVLEDQITETVRNRSVTEYYCSNGTNVKEPPKELLGSGKKIVVIMDEVDGMSGGDRGGGVELAAQIKKTKVPIICICNDERSSKVQPLLRVCFNVKFRRTPASTIQKRILEIAKKEGLDISPNAIETLVQYTRNDIRQIINILSTYRLGKKEMNFDQAKEVGRNNEKYSQMGLFDIPSALLSSLKWNETTLQQKSNVYFHDYNLAHLMIWENYLKTIPEVVTRCPHGGPENPNTVMLKAMAQASESMAEGDVVDALIHGTTQNYSLMPIHSFASCVYPASFIRGNLSGGRMDFPKWLGQNSKALKSFRTLKELQGRISSTGLADRGETRMNYIPILTNRIFYALKNDNFEEAVELMDKYHLDCESLDMLNELSLSTTKPFAMITPSIKTRFTKFYNSRKHPIIFQTLGAPVKKVYNQDPVGDQVEGLFEEEEVEEEVGSYDVSEEEDLESSIKKDKYIKIGKVKSGKPAATKSKASKPQTKTSRKK
ncbi:replication factor RFC1 C terminal domain-containing protein [Phycomyces nitens]|nr:replication factor RFC1 C terminal domain-containing protein [Phycomyces nitens]